MTDVESTSTEVPVPEPVPEPAPEEAPRITNSVEGGRKQKEAVKKLWEYSREASRKMSKAASAKADSDDDDEEHEAPKEASSSYVSMGNLIGIAGVAVAVVCLYLSYGKVEAAPTAASPQFAAPPVRQATKAAPARPKFRRL